MPHTYGTTSDERQPDSQPSLDRPPILHAALREEFRSGYQHIRRRQIWEILIVSTLLMLYHRRWIAEFLIVAMLIAVMVVEIGLWVIGGSHVVADVVTIGCLFGLVTLWVYTNKNALAQWNDHTSHEDDRDHQDEHRNDR